MSSGSWVGFFAPVKTPDAIALLLNTEINRILKSQDVQEKLAGTAAAVLARR